MTYLSKQLSELMYENKIRSQQQLANELKIKQSTISNWLSGRNNPNYEQLKNLCNFFNISADILLDTNCNN